MNYLILFYEFFKIGLFTFGGGYAMIPMIQQTVLTNEWLSQQELIDFIAVSESTPGPFAVNIATYVGVETNGLFGGVCATLGVVLPSFIIILLIAKFYAKFRKQTMVKSALTGIKPVVIGLIATALFSVIRNVILPNGIRINAENLRNMLLTVVIAAVLFILKKRKVKAVGLIACSALLGILFFGLTDLLVPVK